jgi:UDP-glucose 4-epimerase
LGLIFAWRKFPQEWCASVSLDLSEARGDDHPGDGRAGYIGSHMVHALADAGKHVVVFDNLSTGFDWAIPKAADLVVGDTGDHGLVATLIARHRVEAIIHFAASIVVPDSVADPLGYYRNNTANTRTLIECAVKGGVKQFIFSSTAAVYGNPDQVPVGEDDPLKPMSPYGSSKLMTEIMLRDAGHAHGLAHVILRYFADPSLRTGQSTKGATHLIKVAVESALGLRAKMQVYGTDYPTPDGTCVRDYIHVCDLVRAHSDALAYLGNGGASTTLNCGYGRGFSVFEVIDTVKRVSGVDFRVDTAARRAGDPAQIVVIHPQSNAWAVGLVPNRSTILVTSALLATLTRDELAGVLAHELAHVRSRDTVVMTIVVAMSTSITSIATMLSLLGFAMGRRKGLAMQVLGSLMAIATALLSFAIRREQQYQADQLAAEICRHPEWLIAALRKLERQARRRKSGDDLVGPAVAFALFVGPGRSYGTSGVFSSHPPISLRIARLERQLLSMNRDGSRPS